MKRMNIIPSVVIAGWYCVMGIAGMDLNGVTGEPHFYETLEQGDKKAILEVLKGANLKTDREKTGAVNKRSAPTITNNFATGMVKETEKNKNEDIELGELAISYVGLEDLRTYWKNESPENLKKLIDPQKAFAIPLGILEKEKGKEFVVMVPSREKTEKGMSWRISQSGPSKDFQEVENGRLEMMAKEYHKQGKKCECFMIWVPSVMQYFLGDQTSGKLEIILLRNGPGSFKKGERVPASVVFKELAKEAVSGKYDYPPFNPTKPSL